MARVSVLSASVIFPRRDLPRRHRKIPVHRGALAGEAGDGAGHRGRTEKLPTFRVEAEDTALGQGLLRARKGALHHKVAHRPMNADAAACSFAFAEGGNPHVQFFRAPFRQMG